ncbi:MAG: hypothetical protein WD875_10625 [Pirellulales bacterium]
MQKVADAIRSVTAKVQRAIDEGYRSRAIDADDLVEVLLAVAEELDPPTRRAQTTKPPRTLRGRRNQSGR